MKTSLYGVLICIFFITIIIWPVCGTANWIEEQKLLPSEAGSTNAFGCSVSLFDDTALIGAFNDDNKKGSVYVFIRTGTSWAQQAKIFAADGLVGDQFGYSVSLDGDTALIGARGDDNNSGSAYIFTRTGITWTQQIKLTSSISGANFGTSVSLDGDTALIAASFENTNQGAAYVFINDGTTWIQQAKLLASDGEKMNFFGWSVSLSGDTALIGAGYGAYVFTRTGTIWTQEAKLFDSEVSTYSNFYVSVDGDSALISINEEVVYVLIRTGTSWIIQQQLLPSINVPRFGSSVSLYGDTALIGALKDNGKENGSGTSYLFTRSGTTWIQQAKLFAADGTTGDYFGASVSLDGNTALIAASIWSKINNSVYVFILGIDNNSPDANFIWMPSSPIINQQIIFNASASYDPDGFITSYDWDWNNDGIFEYSNSIPIAMHSWTQIGTYPVTLRVTDNSGATNSISLSIDVKIGDENNGIDNDGTPGFEIIILFVAICVTLLILRREK